MRAILTYHSIDASGSPISVDEASFRNHVNWFATSGIRVVSIPELLTLPGEVNAVALTFDDAFANFASLAWPLLRERGWPVTLFVPTDYAGGSNEWDRPSPRSANPWLPVCDWETLCKLKEEGVTLGAHTRTHADLPALSDAALLDELAGSSDRLLSETGLRPTTFAYPYGKLNARIAREAAKVFSLACTTELRLLAAQEDPLRLPRLDAYYLRDGHWLNRWGTADLQRRVWLRGRARGVRHLLAETGAVR